MRRLSTTRTALPPIHASTNLGGITIYALNERDLQLGLAELLAALENCLGLELMVTKSFAITAASTALSSIVPNRLSTAAFGKVLGQGNAGAIPCLTVNGRVFRLYVRADRYAELMAWVRRVEKLLGERMTLTADEVVKMEPVAGEKPLNWFCANHLLWHLAYRGLAIWIGDGIFVSSGKVFTSAIRAPRN